MTTQKPPLTLPVVKLDQGIHVMHLFYRMDRVGWAELPAGGSAQVRARLEALCAANAAPSRPRLTTYTNVGDKADLVFMLQTAGLAEIAQLHRVLEQCFAAGTLERVYSYLSVTELTEYGTTEDDHRQLLVQQEKLQPGTEPFAQRVAELAKRKAEYEHYRLYPELPDWEVMGFYPMSKPPHTPDNCYALDFATRKRLMGGHARVGRKFAGRVSQLITGSTGVHASEWGVTLMAHPVEARKATGDESR